MRALLADHPRVDRVAREDVDELLVVHLAVAVGVAREDEVCDLLIVERHLRRGFVSGRPR